MDRSPNISAASKNPNYRRMHDGTLEKIRKTLRKIQTSGRSYDTLAQIIKDVSAFSGVARSTIKPYRNAEAYHLVASYFANLGIDPSNVPDEVADEHVLRIKLALLRAEHAELRRELKQHLDRSNLVPQMSAIEGESTLTELYHTFAQLLLRSHGSIFIDTKAGQLIDKFPERGFDRLIASGRIVRELGEWLKTHPTFGLKREIISDA